MNNAMNLIVSIGLVAVVCAATLGAYGQPPETAEPQEEPAASYKDERGRFIYDSLVTPADVVKGRASLPSPPPEEIERIRRHEEELGRRAEELDRHAGGLRRRTEELDRHAAELGRREDELADRERDLDMFAEELDQRAYELGLGEPEIEEVVIETQGSPLLKLWLSAVVLCSMAVAAILWICALIDCLRRGQDEFPTRGANDKLVWVLVLLFTSAIGALLYVFLVRGQPRSAV